jgi:hypothetical protein
MRVRRSSSLARSAPQARSRANDNDVDPGRYERHYSEIRRADEVQIYESIMTDAGGSVTTGLLRATTFAKDNRLLPRGFDKNGAAPDIAVRGDAAADADFTAEGDRVRYVVGLAAAPGPFRVEVELRYQPISFRWAHNLKPYAADEPRRFVSFFDSMSSHSSAVIARTTLMVPGAAPRSQRN